MKTDFSKDLVSVIIPTHNRARFLREALQSVFEQKYRPIEIIVVDDGSDDDMGTVVEKWWTSKNSNEGLVLEYLRQDNKGACAARNKGLELSKGEFIQYLDSDDILHPDKIEAQIRVMEENPECEVVYSKTGIFRDQPDWDDAPLLFGKASEYDKMIASFVEQPLWHTSASIYRRSICVRVGLWGEKIKRCQDWEYNIRILLENPIIEYVDEILSLARFHTEGRISDPNMSVDVIANLIVVYSDVEKLLRTHDKYCEHCGKVFYRRYFSLYKTSLKMGENALAREIRNRMDKTDSNEKCYFVNRLWMKMVFLPQPIAKSIAQVDYIWYQVIRKFLGRLKRRMLRTIRVQ